METKEHEQQHLINTELVRYLYSQSTYASYGSMGIALFVCFMLWTIQPHHQLLIWIAGVLLIALIRFTLKWRLPENPSELQNHR